jgi:hypothetical protein
MLILAGLAYAERPTEGGLFAFDAADRVAVWDTPDGRIRVHYSAEGPSQALLDDADGDGVPDFVALVGEEVGRAWDHLASLGFRPPVSEAELDLGPLGGSSAFDVYLLDFGGNADGAFRTDGCDLSRCAGYLTIENDFRGYGYPSLDEAVDTLASHELFHAVQAAYHPDWPVWASEGMAVWAQRSFDPENRDFLRYAREYLADAARPLDRPPAGPVPTFAYATGLWFDFLALRHGSEILVDLAEEVAATPGDEADVLSAIGSVLAFRGDTWENAFLTFTSWNLATGLRAGALDGYPYAARLTPGVTFVSDGPLWMDDPRVFPLAAVFARVDHPGGAFDLGFATCEPVAVQAVVAPALGSPYGDAGPPVSSADLQDLPAGAYYVGLTLPYPGPASVKVPVCIGPGGNAACFIDCYPPGPDTDGDGTGPRCGCQAQPVAGWAAGWWLLLAFAMVKRRSRKDVRLRETFTLL